MDPSVFTPDVRFEPWWWEAAPRPRLAEAPLPAASDVVVVGSGFTGLSAALELARAGREVLVLEAGEPGEGASSRNGGMIGSGHRLMFDDLARRNGAETARAVLGEGLAALEFTAGLIEREQIACHFARTGRFRAACAPAHYDAIGRETERLRKEIGLEAEMVPRGEQHREVATDFYHGGCLYPRHGGLHPGLFHQGLLDRVIAAGAAIAARTPALGIDRQGAGFEVATPRGRVRAGQVVVASNGYTGAESPAFRRRLVPISAYMIATEPLEPTRLKGLIPGGRMIVETRRRHCYYRLSPDGRRLLFGGRAALHAVDPGRSGARLRGFLADLFPELASVRVSHSWSGRLGFTMDDLPHIGVRDGVHFALGYNGSGVAMAPWLGHRIARKLLGDAEGAGPFERLPFAAVPLYFGRPWFLPLLDVWFRARDRVGL